MSEKDLDIAIEKCKRIMEFDTRTLKNPESENGYIFEKVYDLLQFLSQFQFETNTKVNGMDSSQTADTRPVVHGKWIGSDTQCGIACSVCGTPVDDFCGSIDYILLEYKPNFCPHCGAKMDGNGNG